MKAKVAKRSGFLETSWRAEAGFFSVLVFYLSGQIEEIGGESVGRISLTWIL